MSIKKLMNIFGRNHCPGCDCSVNKFRPIEQRVMNSLAFIEPAPDGFETLSIQNYYCPICNANDRDRLILSYLLSNFSPNTSILEIAPSRSIQKRLLNDRFTYRCCDLYMENVDDICDITNMTCYLDKSFDIVICSHVLEHIHEDAKAMSEIARILKPHGQALILTPLPIGLQDNIYDPLITDIEDRVKYYGQDDHVRMYGKQGLTDLIKNSGLDLKTWMQYDSKVGFSLMGLSPTSTLYIGIKPE